jgi:uncharacterized repeat protein (TIGR03803 family)
MKHPRVLCSFLLAIVLNLIVLPGAHGAIVAFTNIYAFSATSSGTNADGSSPQASLLLVSDTLFGVTYGGGAAGKGTIFRVNTNGGNFTNLHSFAVMATNALGIFTNKDGANPVAELIMSGNTLYGTAQSGGTSGRGTVFRVNIDGSGFTNLHNFLDILPPFYTNLDGAIPHGALVLSGGSGGGGSGSGTLYGTTQGGGRSARGTVFRVNTDGSEFTNLASFSGFQDGQNPLGGMVLAGDTLYGTASTGGNYVSGAIFKVNTNGIGLTNVYTFTATGDSIYTNADGAQSFCTLLLAGGTLYGTASIGGNSEKGTVFSVSTSGSGFKTLRSFSGYDGANPEAGLTLVGGTLYGTGYAGGSASYGTVFSIGTNGNDFAILHNTAALEGAFPSAGVVASGTSLYGAGSGGGAHGSGALFRLFIPPSLNIARAGTNVVLRWSTNYGNSFALQSTTNINTLSTSAWTWASSPPAPIVNGLETVTNAIFHDWKFAESSRKITTTASAKPTPRPRSISCIGGICPRTSTVDPLGGSPVAEIACVTSPATWPKSSPLMFAVRLTWRFILYRSY